MAKLIDVTEPCPVHRFCGGLRKASLCRMAQGACVRVLRGLRDAIDCRLYRMEQADRAAADKR